MDKYLKLKVIKQTSRLIRYHMLADVVNMLVEFENSLRRITFLNIGLKTLCYDTISSDVHHLVIFFFIFTGFKSLAQI